MDEATATGSRVDFARICVEIDAAFSFPQTTHLEVDGIQEDIQVDYNWHPHPCAVCSSFGHEEGSCSKTVSTLSAMEITAPATCGLVQGEAVAAPGDTSISPSLVTEPQVVQLQSPSMEVAPPTSKDHLLQQTPDQHKGVSETSSSSSMEKRQVDVDSTSKATKTKYRTTPHAKKGVFCSSEGSEPILRASCF